MQICVTQGDEGPGLPMTLVFTAMFFLMLFRAVIPFVRDQRAFVEGIARSRAKSRFLHPLGKGDFETEFRQQWRLRFLLWPVFIGYSIGVAVMWVDVLL